MTPRTKQGLLALLALLALAAPLAPARPAEARRHRARPQPQPTQQQASQRRAWDRPVGLRSEQRLSGRKLQRQFRWPGLQEVVIPASAIKGPPRWDNVPLPKNHVAYSLKERDGQAGREVVVQKIRVKDIPLTSDKVLRSIDSLAQRFAEQPRVGRPSVTRVSEDGARYPVYKIDVPAQGAPAGAARRKSGAGTRGQRPLKVLISSWVHGDEPVGPATALKLVDLALRQKGFRRDFDLSVLIKVDPYGKRRTPEGVDPNRAFADGKWTPATAALGKASDKKKYDLFVDLHADVEPGFFLISEADRGGVSRRALSAMKTQALLDGTRANPKVGDYDFKVLGGAETKGLSSCFDRLMADRGVPYSYTMEAPRTLPPDQQVRGMLKLLRSTMYNVARHGQLD